MAIQYTEIFPDLVGNPNLPSPKGYHLLVQPIPVAEQSKGGILIPDSSQEIHQYRQNVGRVLAMGPEAYKKMPEPWCKVGDFIHLRNVAGYSIRMPIGKRVHKLIYINDDEVLGQIDNPDPSDLFV